jgi:membrane-associated phospholipid phosphatase
MEPSDQFGFPSGHAAASLSVALSIATPLPAPFAVILLCWPA